MLLEDIRQGQGAHLEAAVQKAVTGEEVQHKGAEAAHGPFLHRQQRLMLPGQMTNQVLVQRLGESRVGDCGREAHGAELVLSDQAFGQPRAEGQKRDARTLPNQPTAPDLQRRRDGRDRDAGPLSARVADRARALIEQSLRRHHAGEFRLIRRGHHDKARQGAEIADVEGPGVGGAVCADEPRPVEGEAHRPLLDRHVVHDLVVPAL
eukprot:gene22124-gene22114